MFRSIRIVAFSDVSCVRTPLAAALLVIGLASPVRAAASAGPASPVKECTAEDGQHYIEDGRYKDAIREFTCVIEAQPTEVDGYRGRIEAQLLIGRYSDALRDYARVTAFVLPVHPDAAETIFASYADRLAIEPQSISALTGASFARWWDFQYATAIQLLDSLLDVQPEDLYGNLFRGSSRLLLGATPAQGAADLEYAIALAPKSADVRFIVSDAYTYGSPDPIRALQEATFALQRGLDTPRVHAILASAYSALGDESAAAAHIQQHLQLVTTQLLTTSPLDEGTSLALDLVPGRTGDIPVPAIAGETLSIATSSRDFTDTILVLLAPDGTPVVGSDDARQYFAGLEWAAGVTGTYRLRVTSFEGINTGELMVRRK